MKIFSFKNRSRISRPKMDFIQLFSFTFLFEIVNWHVCNEDEPKRILCAKPFSISCLQVGRVCSFARVCVNVSRGGN